jgi:hypothetical protein
MVGNYHRDHRKYGEFLTYVGKLAATAKNKPRRA